MRNNAIIGLGSNVNPKENIKKAQDLLAEKFKILGKSKFLQTKPIGYLEQADFINGSIKIETSLNFEELKRELKSLEKQLGRTPSPIKYGPRTIDLDIIVYNREITDEDFYERYFVKEAALELIPELEY